MPAGTGFFVSMPVEGQWSGVYFVTARHVIDASRPFGQLYVRVNIAGGEYVDAELAPQDDWEFHAKTDVAAVPVVIDSRQLDVRAIPIEFLLSDQRIAEAADTRGAPAMTEGDEIVLIGLFTSHPGASRSEPVARFGHIARMPYDPIPITMDRAPGSRAVPVTAYLCEATSYGGQSGSPAFVFFAPDRVPGVITSGGPLGTWALLGLVHGHYPYQENIKVTSGELTGSGSLDFNLGISVVIPAQDILDVLYSEALVEQRKQALDRARAKTTAVADSAIEQSDDSFERFKDLTRELINTPKQKPEDES